MADRVGPPRAIARHRWSEPTRYEHKSERTCLNGCGIISVSHHESSEHWIDYWKAGPDGIPEKIATDKAPPCEVPANG
jgi:hypothetical protein